jgi:hypothetical protein
MVPAVTAEEELSDGHAVIQQDGERAKRLGRELAVNYVH